jgi:uncharacterized membrane protein
MKHPILTRPIAALLLALPFAHAEDQKLEEKKDAQKSEKKSSSSSVVTSADGTATITIDINGKKETRTFKLGDGNNTFSFDKEGGGAKAGGAVGFGGNKKPMQPGQVQREKGLWLGVAMEPVQDVVRAQLSLEPGEGVVINHVAPDGPAAKAGLEPNDILLRFEDQIIVEPAQLKKLIAMKKPGESVKLTYLRKGERHDTSAKLIEHEIEPGDGGPMQWFGNQHGVFNFPVPAPGIAKQFDLDHLEEQLKRLKDVRPGIEKRLEGMQDQLRQLKEKHPGVIVEKREWMSGSPEQMLKGQIEKLMRGLDESKLPREEIEKLRKELERAKREAMEAMERAKRGTEEAVKNAQQAVEDAAKALNDARKPHEKEKGEQPRKPGEPL